ncbi:hypothetical protein F5146DRAFT_633538 [Armillaria mellea]|nr:hypothetical protein F5146DRAFT_633538 [Armillaria mellea]
MEGVMILPRFWLRLPYVVGSDGSTSTGDCHAALGDPSYTGLGFHGASEAVRANPPLNLAMTVTKRTASPIYDLRNGSVMDIEIPFYQHPGLMHLTPDSWWAPVPADRDAPLPASIDANAFRNFTFSVYNGAYGNVSDVFSVPNAMMNTMVLLISTSNSLFAYEHAKDLLAYTLRSGSNLPATAAFKLHPWVCLLYPRSTADIAGPHGSCSWSSVALSYSVVTSSSCLPPCGTGTATRLSSPKWILPLDSWVVAAAIITRRTLFRGYSMSARERWWIAWRPLHFGS